MIDEWTSGDGGDFVSDSPWGDIEEDFEEPQTSESVNETASGDNTTAAVTYEVPPALPSRWLPDFWAVAAFSAVAVSHVLLLFSQHWSVAFRCKMNYEKSNTVEEGSYLMFKPLAHQGKVSTLSSWCT